jgi:hypothetical protein
MLAVGASVPVTGTPGVTGTTSVGATTVMSGGITVSWYFTGEAAAGEPKALKNTALRIKIEKRAAFNFIGTPFSIMPFPGGNSPMPSITSGCWLCY